MTHSPPWTIFALELLSDWKVHSREEIIQKMAVRVPAEKAYRKAEQHRMYKHERNADGTKADPQNKPRQKGDAVDSGRRQIVNSSLGNLRRSGIIEISGDTIRLLKFPNYWKPKVIKCDLCDQELDPTAPGTKFFLHGWGTVREPGAGGTNQVTNIQKMDKYAHGTCLR